MARLRDIKKYVRYGLESRPFVMSPISDEISEQAIVAAQAIRGDDRPAAIIIHGVLPRSGTVYVGELLRLHPDVYAFPNNIWEFPFLQQVPGVQKLEEEFIFSYEQNMGKIGTCDFLPLFGASLIAYLHAATPPGKRILLKVPSVQYLDRFFQVFPHEQLLMLTRDGRDVVHSTIKTWPQLRFSMACARWRRAAQMTLACHERYQTRPTGYWMGRFEDALQEPEAFVRAACARFGLDPEVYPFDRMRQIPIHGSSTNKRDGKVTWRPVSKDESFNPVGRWQSWSSLRKAVFKSIAGKQLVALGYANDMKW